MITDSDLRWLRSVAEMIAEDYPITAFKLSELVKREATCTDERPCLSCYLGDEGCLTGREHDA